MKALKTILGHFPEYYLILLTVLSVYTPPFSFGINPFAITVLAILVLQVIYNNKAAGLTIAGLFIAGNLYMLLALLSEFNEFPAFTPPAQKLLYVGLSLFALNITVSVLMIARYTRATEEVVVRVAESA
ncbi:hypothetical protein [Hufsiella ginkgonis]|uniref:Uncharacterized protein n=1 Tax=Hufsiella ginkgonis TaxID=2695274 RepID=A0A7K1Y368_9SPHI|nr:hypothetical protein [Hufsiella ginkgonis]MXV17743.1 hypothetical protein [Hufsiella ginkgonis]